MKKYIGIIVCFIMLLAAVAMGSYAAGADIVESGECGENVSYTLDSDGVLTISGNGEMENYNDWSNYSLFYKNESVKKVIIKEGVTSLGNYAFYWCSGLTSITIPNSVISIGYGAFSGCFNLKSVSIPNSVTSLGGCVFSDCSGLTNVSISNGVTSIGYDAFSGCSGLTSVTIPNSVISIGERAFYNCPCLTSVTIPNSVTSIGNYAFSGCSSLTSVIIPDSVTSISGSTFSSNMIIFGKVGSYAQQFCKKNDMIFVEEEPCTPGHTWDNGKITKNATANSKGTKIYTCKICGDKKTEYLFKDEYLLASGAAENSKWFFDRDGTLTIIGEDYTLPDNFKIGEFNAPGDWFDFADEIKSIVINGSFGTLGKASFMYCDNLENIDINGVKALKCYGSNGPFEKCKHLINAKIGDDVYIIGGNAFYECSNLKTLSLGKDVKLINGNMVAICNKLKNIQFESGDVVISKMALAFCSRDYMYCTNINLPEGKTIICEDAFYDSSVDLHFFGDLPELRGELNTDEYGKVICYYPCSNDTWNTRLPRTAEWRVEHTFGEWKSINNNTQHQRICTKDPTHII